QAFDDRIRIIPLELELGAQEHWVIQVTPSVGEAELVALANLNGALFIDDLGRAHEPADLIRALAGISAHGAADRAGNPDQALQSGKTVPRRLGDERRQRRAATGADALIRHLDTPEARLAKP